MAFGIISGIIGIAGAAIAADEAKKASRAATREADRDEAEAKRIRENIRVEEAGAKFQAGLPSRSIGSADDFLNPLRLS